MTELAWPFVALVAIATIGYFANRLVLSRKAEDALQAQIEALQAGKETGSVTYDYVNMKHEMVNKKVEALERKFQTAELTKLGMIR